jgi:hypothetical protein
VAKKWLNSKKTQLWPKNKNMQISKTKKTMSKATIDFLFSIAFILCQENSKTVEDARFGSSKTPFLVLFSFAQSPWSPRISLSWPLFCFPAHFSTSILQNP